MAEALDAAIQAREAQQAAALAGRNKSHVQLEIPKDSQQCEWFVLCDNLATHDKLHPILGSIPCCDRCGRVGE